MSFKAGERVVYATESRALDASTATANEKYWVVDQILDGGRLLLRTRRGGMRVVPERSAQLRRPFWWESVLMRGRFPGGGEVRA